MAVWSKGPTIRVKKPKQLKTIRVTPAGKVKMSKVR